MIKIPGMIMIGATDRNVGKTEFASSLIRKFCSQCDVIGIKVTTIEHTNVSCPRGGAGCGTCTSLEGDFCITEETDSQSNKDTCRMLAAGAKKVFWLRVLKQHLEEGMNALQAAIGIDAVTVCESNSLRLIVEPGLFFIVKAVGSDKCKPSTASVDKYADRTVLFDGNDIDIRLDEIKLFDGKWVYKMQATAIIMAGGQSRRMVQDKSMLPINGVPAIKHVLDQIKLHFDQILISSNNLDEHSFAGAEIVPDEVAGMGPLMGIASALRVSRNEINFVIACDIPQVDVCFVRRMVRQSKDFDAVLPKVGPSRYEPLFAIYKKNILGEIDKAITSERYRVIDPLENCKVRYFDSPDEMKLRNLNTMNDYRDFIGKDNSVNI